MAICQCMIQAFMFGWENDSYGRRDLEVGLEYAQDLLVQRYKKEPFHHYDLKKFIAWCEEKLKTYPKAFFEANQ